MCHALDSGQTSHLNLALVQPSPHPGWPESHLKLWNCIPFSGPIDSGAVSKTNGGFRKSILMKEKEQRKERYLEKGGGKRTGGGPLKVAMKGIKKHREWGKGEKERSRAGICVCVCVCVFIERVCKIMCALCNTVCIEGWWWVGWVDLATVRPISSSAVWNGCLATVTCKAHSSTETYISFIWPAHQHHIKSGSWIMSAALG